METVIAIGVLAVLLTGFIAVFAPATAGIRKAIGIQEADRLVFALEKELVTLRSGSSSEYETGFAKAYEWIEGSSNSGEAVLVYQYRAQIGETPRSDGTAEPYTRTDGVAGENFVMQPIARRKSDPQLMDDLEALEGRLYAVKMTQLVFDGNKLELGDEGKIAPPSGEGSSSSAENYPDAVIAFASEFFLLPSTSAQYVENNLNIDDLKSPVFTRNLAVRR